MWAELVSTGSIDLRIWPRLAAIAERFWSPQNVTDVDDMYRRLAIEDVRLEQLGLGDESHTDRFLRRIMNGPGIAPIAELLRFAEPVTLGQRVRGAPSVQMTPLVQMVDAARPDPPARWKVQQMVSDMLAATTTGAASRDSLARSVHRALACSMSKRPNNAMELTTSRRIIQLYMSSTRQSAAIRALPRGSSSWSR